MARSMVIGARCPNSGRMMIVVPHVATCKKAVDLMESDAMVLRTGVSLSIESSELLDDVEGMKVEYTYNRFCAILKKVGRIHVIVDGVRVFQIVDGSVGEVRGPDLDDDGSPICNPAK